MGQESLKVSKMYYFPLPLTICLSNKVIFKYMNIYMYNSLVGC